MADPEAPRKNGALVVVIVGLILSASAALMWLLATRSTEPPASMTGGASAAQLIEGERPEVVDDAVKAAAAKLAADPAAVLAAVKAAIDAGHLPALHELEEPIGAPRAAGVLAPALSGQKGPAAGPLEVIALARALLTAKGVTVEVGYDDAAPKAATDLRRRRYVLRAGTGPWAAVDGQPVDEKKVAALDDARWMAQVSAWRAMGAMALRDGDGATKHMARARELDKQDPAVELLSGQVQIAMGQAEEGLATMEAAAARRADAMTWFTVGIASMQAAQSFKAHQHLTKAAELDATFGEAHVMLAQLTLERASLTPKEEQPKVLEAAKGHLAAAEKADPRAPGLRTMKARIAVIEDRTDDAEPLLREEAELHPGEESSWLVLASFLTELGRGAEALKVLEEGAKVVRGGSEIHRALGTALYREGRAPEALTALEAALAGDPGSADLRPAIAQIHKALGRPEVARKLLGEHLGRFPEDANARLLAAQLELDEQQDAKAEEHLSAVLAADPNHVDALMLRYVADVVRKRDATASRAAIVKAAGKRSTVAQVLLENGMVEEGEVLLREALAKDASDAEAPLMLVAVLAMTERGAEATALKDAVLAKAPEAERAELAAQLEDAIKQGTDAVAPAGQGTDAVAPAGQGGAVPVEAQP